jgi:hypothetical protein
VWLVAEARRVMAVRWSGKQKISVGSVDVRCYFLDPNSWVDDWEFGTAGLHINGS